MRGFEKATFSIPPLLSAKSSMAALQVAAVVALAQESSLEPPALPSTLSAQMHGNEGSKHSPNALH
jgi:hypothetical protein